MASSTPSARTRARARMADKLAEQRRREQEVQDRLESFLRAQDTIDSARAKRDAAIAKADRALAAAQESVDDERAEHVAAMRAAGQSVTDIADLTGITAKEVRALARRASRTGADTKRPNPAPVAGDRDDDEAPAAS